DRVHHLPQQRLFTDDLDVVFDIDEMRDAIQQTRQVCDPAGAFELRTTYEFFLNSDQVDRSRSFDQLHHLPKNDSVAVEIEIFGPQTFENTVVVLVIDKNRAENRFLSVDVVWKSSFERLSRHKTEIGNQN